MKRFCFLLILCLLGPTVSADSFDMATYLQSLNKYYYCFSAVGIKSFQAQATVSFSGQLPKGIAKAWQGMDWQNNHSQFDFSYVGSGVMPIMSFSSNGGDAAATPERMRILSNLINGHLEIWGAFIANPVFEPPDSNHTYEIARNPGSAFTIVQRTPKTFMSMDYDDHSLAKGMTVKKGNVTKNIQLQFTPSAQGVLPQHIGLMHHFNTNNLDVATDIVVQYQQVQGFQLPSVITLYERTSGQLFQATFTISNYQIQKAGDLVQSDNGDTQVVTASSETAGTKHFFWRVASPTTTVYLLGSIHVRPRTPLQVPEVVEKAFESSNYVGFECDLSKLDEIEKEFPDYVHDHFSYPPGDDLEKHLTLGQWKVLELAAAKVKVPIVQVRKLKPYIVDDYLGRMGIYDAEVKKAKMYGIDNIFLRKAQKAGKPVFGMEFWYEPYQVLDSLREPEQVYYLFGSSAASSNQVRFMDEIFADWKTGNTVDLESLTYNGLSLDDRAIMDEILKKRNEIWILQMDRILKTGGTYFIVVGSAHLVGPTGLPSLLSQKGYMVGQL